MINEPIYCKDCNSRNSWAYFPERNATFQPSGVVFEYAYKCKNCGKVILLPAVMVGKK
jgi:hypothetical protein